MNASFSRTPTVFREGYFLYRKFQIICWVKRKEVSYFFLLGSISVSCKSGISITVELEQLVSSVLWFVAALLVVPVDFLTMKDIILVLDFLPLYGSPCLSNLNTICKSLLAIPTTTTTKQKKSLYQPTSHIENCLKVLSG